MPGTGIRLARSPGDCRTGPTTNRPSFTPLQRRLGGVLTVLVLIGLGGAIGAGLATLLMRLPFGFLGTALIASSLLAHRSLDTHVADVAKALLLGLGAGRPAGLASTVPRALPSTNRV